MDVKGEGEGCAKVFLYCFMMGAFSAICEAVDQDSYDNIIQSTKYLCKSQFAEQAAKKGIDISVSGQETSLELTNHKSTCSWTFNRLDGETTILEYPVIPKTDIAPAIS